MKEERILFCEAIGEDGISFRLSYSLTDCRINLEETEHTVYGLRCRMETKEEGKFIEEAEICDISSDMGMVTRLQQELCNGQATPIHLRDIICDCLC